MVDDWMPRENAGGEDVEVFPPETIPATAADEGTVESAPPPVPETPYHEYELDLADTAAIFQPGAQVDTGMVLHYLLDRGYTTLSVEAQVDAEGQTTGLLTVRTYPLDDDVTPGEEITPAHWAAYTGSRYQGIVETVVAWADTAEGAVTPKPNLDRVIALWMHLEAHGLQVDHITVPWNVRYPLSAPAAPQMTVAAYGAVASALITSFAFSALKAADRAAFEAHWDSVTQSTTIRRTVQGRAAIDDYQYSSVVLWAPPIGAVSDTVAAAIEVARAYQVGRQRNGDVVRVLGSSGTFPMTAHWYVLRYLGDGTIVAGKYPPTHYQHLGTTANLDDSLAFLDREGALSLGERTIVDVPNATAVGVAAEVHGEAGVAFGTRAQVAPDAFRAIAIGTDALADADDLAVIRANTLRIMRSSADPLTPTNLAFETGSGDIHTLRINANGQLLVDGVPYLPIGAGNVGGVLTGADKSTTSTTTDDTLIVDTDIAFGAGTWSVLITGSAVFQRSVASGFLVFGVRVDGVNVGGNSLAYGGGQIALVKNMMRTGLAGNQTHSFGLAFRGANTAGTTTGRFPEIRISAWRTA